MPEWRIGRLWLTLLVGYALWGPIPYPVAQSALAGRWGVGLRFGVLSPVHIEWREQMWPSTLPRSCRIYDADRTGVVISDVVNPSPMPGMWREPDGRPVINHGVGLMDTRELTIRRHPTFGTTALTAVALGWAVWVWAPVRRFRRPAQPRDLAAAPLYDGGEPRGGPG